MLHRARTIWIWFRWSHMRALFLDRISAPNIIKSALTYSAHTVRGHLASSQTRLCGGGDVHGSRKRVSVRKPSRQRKHYWSISVYHVQFR